VLGVRYYPSPWIQPDGAHGGASPGVRDALAVDVQYPIHRLHVLVHQQQRHALVSSAHWAPHLQKHNVVHLQRMTFLILCLQGRESDPSVWIF